MLSYSPFHSIFVSVSLLTLFVRAPAAPSKCMRVAYFSLFGANEARKLPLAPFKCAHTQLNVNSIIHSLSLSLSLCTSELYYWAQEWQYYGLPLSLEISGLPLRLFTERSAFWYRLPLSVSRSLPLLTSADNLFRRRSQICIPLVGALNWRRRSVKLHE